MPSSYASGKKAIAECDRCGFQYLRRELREITIKTKNTNIQVCPTCWEPDQPQLQLGMYPIDDPQAIRNPRPDTSYRQAGLTGLQLVTSPASSSQAFGTPSGGSRVVQWGWGPVGLNNPLQLTGLTDTLQATGAVGTVTVTTS